MQSNHKSNGHTRTNFALHHTCLQGGSVEKNIGLWYFFFPEFVSYCIRDCRDIPQLLWTLLHLRGNISLDTLRDFQVPFLL